MAKLNPDNLRAEPADSTATRTHYGAADLSDVQKFIGDVKSLLVGDEYNYAEATLRGMLKTAHGGIITDRMRQALENIKARPHRGSRRDRNRGGW